MANCVCVCVCFGRRRRILPYSLFLQLLVLNGRMDYKGLLSLPRVGVVCGAKDNRVVGVVIHIA